MENQSFTKQPRSHGEVPPDGEQPPFEPNTLVIEDEALRRGFTSAPNYILEDITVSMAARLTFILLLSFAWKEGSCFPGQARLAGKLGVTRKAVNKYLKELKERGYVDWHRRGMGKTNVYRILKLHSLQSEADVTKRLHQDVTAQSPLNVTSRLHKEDTEKQDTVRKDSDPSKFRKGNALLKKRIDRANNGQSHQEATPVPLKAENTQDAAFSNKIAGVLDVFSKQDLHDPIHIHSNITRGLNLWRRSKVSEEEFLLLLHEARKVTLARSGTIRKRADNYMGFKNHAPYFFQVLQDLIGQNALQKFRGTLIRHTTIP